MSSVSDFGKNLAVSLSSHGDIDSSAIDPSEPSNMSSLLAFEFSQAAPESSWSNDVAFSNILSMSSTRDTSHSEMSQSNDEAAWNMQCISFTRDTSHSETSPLNDVAPLNMELISRTRRTGHFEMSPLNDVAP